MKIKFIDLDCYSRTKYDYKICVCFVTVLGKTKHFKFEYKPWANIKHDLRVKRTRLIDIVTRRPVYLSIDSTDCDHYRVVSAYECKNIFEADRVERDAYESAEGATYINRITKVEYEDFERSERDYALEAFEDGHPHHIYR